MSRRADRGARRFADRSGFTLVEALVAFAVMATILGVLYRGVVQTRASAAGFSSRTQEEAVALSLLADFRVRRDLRDGSYAGTRDGRPWTLRASPLDLASQLPKGMDVDKPNSDKPDAGGPAKPVWVAQRLVLRVITSGQPLETEAMHLVKLPPPGSEAP